MKRYTLVEWDDEDHTADIWLVMRENYPNVRTADVTDLVLFAEEVVVPPQFDNSGTYAYLCGYGKVVDTAIERMRTSLRPLPRG